MKNLLICFCVIFIVCCGEYPDDFDIGGADWEDEQGVTACQDSVLLGTKEDIEIEKCPSDSDDTSTTEADTPIGKSPPAEEGIATGDTDIYGDTDTDTDTDTGAGTDTDTDIDDDTDTDSDTQEDTTSTVNTDTDTDTDTGATCNDNDSDGWCPPADCNDNDPFINPDADEIVEPGNFIDDDCDGLTDEKPTK